MCREAPVRRLLLSPARRAGAIPLSPQHHSAGKGLENKSRQSAPGGSRESSGRKKARGKVFKN